MNDNFPACSWATADWYGAPKLSYYVVQDSFAPLQAIVLTDQLNLRGTPAVFAAWLVDDADALDGADWEVRLRAYGKSLQPVKEARFSGHGRVNAPHAVGELCLSYRETDTAPLFITAEVWKDGALAASTFYWYNFENEKGCLFNLPKTALEWRTEGNDVLIRNAGPVAAAGVTLSAPGAADTFRTSDNIFWLAPGQSRTIRVNRPQDLQITAWNAD